MADYIIFDIDDDFWRRVQVMKTIRRISIKKMILDYLQKELTEWERESGDTSQFIFE